MLYKKPSFSVPSTTPTKKPCGVHHFVKGQCLRCPQKVTGRAEITDKGKLVLAADVQVPGERLMRESGVPEDVIEAQRQRLSKYYQHRDSEGAE